jgi:hypothetical protein
MQRTLLFLFVITLSFTACEEGQNSANKIKLAPSTISKSDENANQVITGTVKEASKIDDLGGGLWIHLEPESGEAVYFDFYQKTNPDKFAALPADLVGKTIEIYYKIKTEQVAIDIQTLGLIGGKATKKYDDMTVYTVKGKQRKVERDEMGLLITIETDKGTMLNYRADEEVYFGADPEDYSDLKIQIIYSEEEQLVMNDYRIIE